MKKSLSAILSLAMAFSMFSSVAFGAEDAAAKKSSADFDDLKDLTAEQKVIFDELIGAGVFDGVAEKEFGLKDKMNRAQFAKVAALIFDLEVDASVKTSSFSDVKAEDPANGYALPYIEALKAAGLTDGYAPGQYNPAGEVTKQELATFLVRGLGWEADAKASAGVSDKTVSDWAKGYVAVAIEKKIMTSGEDGTFGGTSAATRDILVLSSYAADKAYVPQGVVNVTEAKAVGVQKVEVTFNKPVDTDKAKLELKAGSSVVATDVKFADDKKSATLTLKDNLKIREGDYTVTLSGYDAAAVGKTVAEFKGENEKLVKIDFLNSNETLAKSKKAVVKIKASNQYGENASLSAGSYTVYAGNNNDAYVKLVKNTAGELLLTLDIDKDSYQSGYGIVPVNIYENDSRINATKNFKVGTSPFISKIELGNARYSNNKDSLATKGESVYYDVVNYDQYGNIVPFNNTEAEKSNTNVQIIGYEPNLKSEVGDYNSDEILEVKLYLSQNVDKAGEYTFSVHNQAGRVTGTVQIKSTKVATKIELGELKDSNVAAGDTEAFMDLVAYDADGNKLSLEDVTNDENLKRIKVSSSFGKAAIETAGENRGKIRLSELPTNSKTVFTVSAQIAEPGVFDNKWKQVTVQPARYPDSFKVVTDPARKIVSGADSAFKIQVLDQYGKELKVLKNVDQNGNVSSSGASYTVAVTTATYGSGMSIDYHTDADAFESRGNSFTVTGAEVEQLNKEHKFKYNGAGNTADAIEITMQILKNNVEISKISRKIEAITANESLNYSVEAVKDLFNAVDNGTVVASTYGPGQDISRETQREATESKLAREVKVVATDAAGNKVAIPKTVTSITGDSSVVKTGVKDNKGFVIGYKKGTSTLNIGFKNNKGETLLRTVSVNVKDEAIKTTKITAKSSVKKSDLPQGANVFVAAEIKVTDNYDVTYEKADAQKYNYLLGVVFTVTNVRNAAGEQATGTVTIDKYGVISYTGTDVASFDIVANTLGQSVSVPVK
ncbi:S-layer homology domain-containing protein [Paenibacillus sp. UNCCL117]|nr:S-layer homology domain-containing protein [Paenibacillus sp. cl123]SFW64369.1 S-layer homology domain-containing protein [Paenibacillus sp. UNCCL117]